MQRALERSRLKFIPFARLSGLETAGDVQSYRMAGHFLNPAVEANRKAFKAADVRIVADCVNLAGCMPA